MSSWESLLQREHLTTAELDATHDAFATDPGLWLAVVRALEEGEARESARAARLLLRAARQGRLPERPRDRAAALADSALPHLTRLHLCQVFATVPCPTQHAARLSEFLVRSADDPQPFVRAWAVSALVRLAADHPEAGPDLAQVVPRLQADPAPSVQARLRKLKLNTAATPPRAAKVKPPRQRKG